MADIKVGVSIPTIIGNPIDMATVAKRAEELGFESLWAPEHTLVPVNVETRFPYSEDGAVPPYYSHMMDPFVALSHASATTSTIKLGTGVTLLPERNPILLAKVIASLDHFSGGRTVIGIGAGWLPGGVGDNGRQLPPPVEPGQGVSAGHEGALDQRGVRVPR